MTAPDQIIAETTAGAPRATPGSAAMSRRALPPGSTATLVNHSENQTWRIDGPAGDPLARLRLHRPRTPALISSWLAGYRREAEPPVGTSAMTQTFVMLRRMLLLAWIGSRAGTGLAQEMGPAFTSGPCDLAEGYLSTNR